MQFDTTVNERHQPEHGPHQRQQPVLEYMFLDDSACNLSSLNLMTFVTEDGDLTSMLSRGVPRDDHGAGNPRRQLELSDAGDREEQPRLPSAGTRYANLGALLMSRGCLTTATAVVSLAVTVVMTGEAYAQSRASRAITAAWFAGYDINREPFLRVMRKHATPPPRTSTTGTFRTILPPAPSRRGTMLPSSAKTSLSQRAGHRRADRHHRLRWTATRPASNPTSRS
jgi:ribonucleoside-diphosphate reductase alpha chain